MNAWSELLSALEGMPQELERTLRVVPPERLRWKPESWGGAPGETFSALEHVRHLRALIHYLRSHDQQHLAGLHWLAGRAASEGLSR